MTRAKVVPLTTAANGTTSVDERLYGELIGIGVRIGTLSTPDVTITDVLTGAAVYSAAGIAADVRIIPRVLVQDATGANIAATYAPPVITGLLRIAVAGGGDTKSGEIVLVFNS